MGRRHRREHARRWLLPVQALGSHLGYRAGYCAAFVQGHAEVGSARVQAFIREQCGPHCMMLSC